MALIERHYRIAEAAKLCGAGSRRTMLRWLEQEGYVIPRPRRPREPILVPEHAVQRVLDRRTMRLKYATDRPRPRTPGAAAPGPGLASASTGHRHGQRVSGGEKSLPVRPAASEVLP